MVVFCCLMYSYKNRTQEIKQNNKWLTSASSAAAIVAAADLSIGFFLKKPTCKILCLGLGKPPTESFKIIRC